MHYVKGATNVIADTFSRLERVDEPSVLEGKNMPLEMPIEPDKGCDIIQDAYMLECFLNLPRLSDPGKNPLNYEYIAQQQLEDEKLQHMASKYPKNYVMKNLNGYDILCYVKNGSDPEMQWRITLPQQMLLSVVQYFHTVLGHPGTSRMRLTLQARYYHPLLRKIIDDFACDACQRNKRPGPGYGLLPERDVEQVPWSEVACDLIGPWTMKLPRKETREVFALTIIDTASNLVELVKIENKTSAHIRRKFHNTWLARYPCPKRIIHDNGGEFTGFPFANLLETLDIKSVPTTSKNPQSNAICE